MMEDDMQDILDLSMWTAKRYIFSMAKKFGDHPSHTSPASHSCILELLPVTRDCSTSFSR